VGLRLGGALKKQIGANGLEIWTYRRGEALLNGWDRRGDPEARRLAPFLKIAKKE